MEIRRIHQEPPLPEGGDSIPTSSFFDRIRNRKADVINKNINTYHMLDTILSASCILTYLMININPEVGTIIISMHS